MVNIEIHKMLSNSKIEITVCLKYEFHPGQKLKRLLEQGASQTITIGRNHWPNKPKHEAKSGEEYSLPRPIEKQRKTENIFNSFPLSSS